MDTYFSPFWCEVGVPDHGAGAKFLVGDPSLRFADGCLAVPSQGRKINSLGSSYKGTNPILGLDLHVLITSQSSTLILSHWC